MALLDKTTAKDRVAGSVATATTPQVFSDGTKDVKAVALVDGYGNLDERLPDLLAELVVQTKMVRMHLELLTEVEFGPEDVD